MESNLHKKHYLIYKTTNLINGKIYVGAHETYDLNDRYLGSGNHLLNSIRKYGREYFKREILEELSSEEEMYQREKEIVDLDFVKRKDTYNIKVGGLGGCEGYTPSIRVRDKDGNEFTAKINDPRYLSGELEAATKGYKICRNINDNTIVYTRCDDPRVLSGELVDVNKGKVSCIDSNGKYCYVLPDDPRIKSGELVRGSYSSNRIVSEETRRKISEACKISLRGERNFFYGKHWVSNPETLEEKILSQEEVEEYMKLGWKLGRFSKRKNPSVKMYYELTKEEKELIEKEKEIKKQERIKRFKENGNQKGKVFITNDVINKLLFPEKAEKLVATGEWKYGKKYNKRKSTIWIHKEDGSRTRILPEKLEEYLLDGWILGANIPGTNL